MWHVTDMWQILWQCDSDVSLTLSPQKIKIKEEKMKNEKIKQNS